MTNRRGFTLLEMMLVLMLIVIIGSLSFPMIGTFLERNRPAAASDQVKASWIRLRNQAMSEGRAYAFKVQDNTGNYRMEPDEDSEQDASEEPPLIAQGELPEGVVFAEEGSTPGSGGSTGGSFKTLVVFLPDGTTKADATILFSMTGQRPRGLQVRGLTGAIVGFEPEARP